MDPPQALPRRALMATNPQQSKPSPGKAAPSVQAFLDTWPDDPMHVEARGLLLERPRARLIEGEAGGLVFIADHGMAVGYGKPEPELSSDLIEVALDLGFRSEFLELHVPVDSGSDWAALPAAEGPVTHRIQTLEAPCSELHASMEQWCTHESGVISSQEDDRLDSLPKALRQEFQSMDPWPTVVACFAGGSIAAIASAFVESESYFDVSIDTVRDFRRAGFGASVAAALIQTQAGRGKAPVWMVRESNQASVALAHKLGFRDVGLVSGMLMRVSP